MVGPLMPMACKYEKRFAAKETGPKPPEGNGSGRGGNDERREERSVGIAELLLPAGLLVGRQMCRANAYGLRKERRA